MPEDGVCSSERTAYKQAQFMRLLNLSLIEYKKLNTKVPYTYIDLTAGDGKNVVDGVSKEGSAILAYRRIKDMPAWNISLVECNWHRHEKLVKHICEIQEAPPQGCSRYVVRFGYEKMLRELLIKRTDIDAEGLIYTDPEGMADLSAFTAFLPYRKNLDVLFHLGCTGLKRIRNATANNLDSTTRSYDPKNLGNHFSKQLESIKGFKKNWFITEPYGKFQWLFLFGTNKEIPTEVLSWMFQPLDSPEGKEYVKMATYTKEELCSLKS